MEAYEGWDARFKVLDRLLDSGWGGVAQNKIPKEVMEAAEQGKPIPRKGFDRDRSLVGNPFARPDPTPEDLDRRARNAARMRASYFHKRGPRASAATAGG